MIDIKDATPNLVHGLGCLLLGCGFFDGDFASNEGNKIGDRVQLQEVVDGQRELAKAEILPSCGLIEMLKFW